MSCDNNVLTVLLEFFVGDMCSNEDIDIFANGIVTNLETIFCSQFRRLCRTENLKVTSAVYSSASDEATVTFKSYKKATNECWITLSIEYLSTSGFGSNLQVQDFYEAAKQHLQAIWSKTATNGMRDNNVLPIIKRTCKISPYFSTSDDRIVEYGFTEVVLDVLSPFQHIQILNTVDHGKILILDGAINIAESDTTTYTHQLMDLQHERSHYGNSRILILGGGDGGLLKELLELEHPPKEVIMIELDECVLDAASKHLRSICGPYLDPDKREGPNYKVVVGDAIKFMEELVSNNEKFDFVFGDLTDVPMNPDCVEQPQTSYVSSPNHQADVWRFLQRILEMGVMLIHPEHGQYMTHCNGKSVPGVLDKYEEILEHLKISVPCSSLDSGSDSESGSGPVFNLKCIFKRSESFVSSFSEVWIFYKLKMIPID